MTGRIICLSLFAALLAPATAAAQDEPPCDPSTPPAAKLTGVPERTVFGRTHVVEASASALDRLIGATVTFGNRAPYPLVSSTLGFPTFAATTFQVPLHQSPLPVRFALVERDPATGATCRRDEQRTVRAVRRFRVRSACSDTRARPHRLWLCTVDWANSYRKLHWRGWNHEVQRGSGLVTIGCAPNFECPVDRAARLRLFRLRSCGPTLYYTRMRVKPAGLPAYTERLDCPSADSA